MLLFAEEWSQLLFVSLLIVPWIPGIRSFTVDIGRYESGSCFVTPKVRSFTLTFRLGVSHETLGDVTPTACRLIGFGQRRYFDSPQLFVSYPVALPVGPGCLKRRESCAVDVCVMTLSEVGPGNPC